jgi:VanZ family protein
MLVFPWPSRRARLVGLAGLFAYSVVVEVLQPVLSSRSAAWGDVAGNAAGVGLVAVAVVATVAFRSARAR